MAKRVVTFSEARARQIIDFIESELGDIPPVSNDGAANKGFKRGIYRNKIWGKITGVAVSGGIAKHSWIEVRWNFDESTWKEIPEGKKGTTTSNYAFQYPSPDTEYATDTIVELTRIERPDTGDTAYIVYGSTLPTGQYQYMVYQNVTDNVSGFDWVRAHDLL